MMEAESRTAETGHPDYACVLLAGGRNKRMGGFSKADLRLGNSTIGRHIEGEMEQTGALCFYSYRVGKPDIPDGWIPVRDDPVLAGSPKGEKDYGSPTSRGPAEGICRALEEAEKYGKSGVYVTPCDLPFFRHQMVPPAADQAKAGSYDAVLWETRDGRKHYTCGYYSIACLPYLREMLQSGDLRLRDLLPHVKTRFLKTDEAGIPDFYLTNVNTTEQYERLAGSRREPSVFCVCGWKNSGKTTLLEKMVRHLTAAGIRTAVIKHDGHDFETDVPGTDSFRMKEAGAYGTAVFSDSKFAIVKEASVSAGDLAACFPEADLILIEGEKNSTYPKIETLRRESERRLAADPATVLAYVKDWDGEDDLFPEGATVLQSTDTGRICELVIRRLDELFKQLLII